MVPEVILAHGVGRVYESPIPVWLYAAGAGGTVLISFLLAPLGGAPAGGYRERVVAGERARRGAARVLVAGAFGALALMIVSGIAQRDQGLSLAVLLFWIGLVIGTVALSTLVAGTWEAADPWATMERLYRIEGAGGQEKIPPWWLGPALLYLLFWFELVSGAGFQDVWVVLAALAYTAFSLSFRASFAERWRLADPLSILFGFAARCAPLRLRAGGIAVRSPLAGIDNDAMMPKALLASLFVLLGSTTLDNVRETVGWTDFRSATGLAAIPDRVVDSVALVGFAGMFLVPFGASVWIAHRWVGGGMPFVEVARRFGWSLMPIGVAYLVAHNAPLLITGLPALVRELSDPLGAGWNLLGTREAFSGFLPAPQLVWFVEIALIVSGHVLGVLGAHRIALRLGATRVEVVRSQYALTLLMILYTVATLWLLSQPLVA